MKCFHLAIAASMALSVEALNLRLMPKFRLDAGQDGKVNSVAADAVVAVDTLDHVDVMSREDDGLANNKNNNNDNYLDRARELFPLQDNHRGLQATTTCGTDGLPNLNTTTCDGNLGCVSGDFTGVGAFLEVGSTCLDCECGDTVNATLFLSLIPNGNSARTAIGYFGTLEAINRVCNGVTIDTCFDERCADPTTLSGSVAVPAGSQGQQIDLNVGTITYSCGDELRLTGVTLFWSTANANDDCVSQNSCGDLDPKCDDEFPEQVINTPLIAVEINQTCQDFTGLKTLTADPLGGTAPFAYVWTNQDNTDIGNNQTIMDIPDGDTVTVVVTDANGCEANATVGALLGCTTPMPTASPTTSPTVSPTVSPTKSPTKSPTTSPTKSPTVSPTKSPTTSPTVSPTKSPTTSPTKSPTASPTKSPTKAPTKAPTASPTGMPTASPTASPTGSPTPSPTPGPTPSPTPGPTPSPTPGPTPSPTPGPTPSPTPGPTPSPTPGPTPSPTPGPTPSPTPGPTPSPTPGPTPSPTKAPTTSPTASPTNSPTKSPTNSPTKSPTGAPTTSPTVSPTESPTTSPTKTPTKSPTESPTGSPTVSPTKGKKFPDLEIPEIGIELPEVIPEIPGEEGLEGSLPDYPKPPDEGPGDEEGDIGFEGSLFYFGSDPLLAGDDNGDRKKNRFLREAEV